MLNAWDEILEFQNHGANEHFLRHSPWVIPRVR